MNINFNNLRLKTVRELRSVIKIMNTGIDSSGRTIELDVEDIKDKINEVVSMVGTIACTYSGSDPGFMDLSCKIGDNVYFASKD